MRASTWMNSTASRSTLSASTDFCLPLTGGVRVGPRTAGPHVDLGLLEAIDGIHALVVHGHAGVGAGQIWRLVFPLKDAALHQQPHKVGRDGDIGRRAANACDRDPDQL